MKWKSIDEPEKLDIITKINISKKSLTELPEWISKCNNLIKLKCSKNKLIQLPKNLPNSLQNLDCSNNQLIKLPKNLPNLLQNLDCSNNQLIKLPKNLPNLLQELWCSNNQLIKLPKNLPNSLQNLWCPYNQLIKLPKNLPNLLQNLWCSDNKLKKLPKNLPNILLKIQCSSNQLIKLPKNLPNSLQELDCSFNKLIKLPENLPNLLQKLNCFYNKLTQLPISIIQLRHITEIKYDLNPLENMPFILSRFLNNLKNYTKIHVYNDSQSVHNNNIEKSIKKSIFNVLQDNYKNDKTLTINEILTDNILDATSKKALVEYSNDHSRHNIINITFEDLLIPIWQRIQKHQYKDEIKKILNIEIKDGLNKCFTRKMSILVSCLNGFYDDINIRIGKNEQIGNIVIMIKQSLEKQNKYTVELHKELARKSLKEMKYKDSVIDEWLEYI
jgi:Leucine-rich repeat (LRR) protein